MTQNLQLVPLSHPAVRRKAEAVKEITLEIKQLAEKMFSVMKEHEGVGLAAPQLGIPLQLIVMEYLPASEKEREKKKAGAPKEKIPRTVLINPKLTSAQGEVEEDEGCLTTQGIYGPVKRAKVVQVEGLNLEGEKVTIKATGLFARVLQHELDHLQGIIFIDRVGNPDQLYTYVPKAPTKLG